MRFNLIICPNCGHTFLDGEHVMLVCDCCGKKFHISESKTSQRPETIGEKQERFHGELEQLVA